jgi:hypothetical protein
VISALCCSHHTFTFFNSGVPGGNYFLRHPKNESVPFTIFVMKITRPCFRPEQLSIFSRPQSPVRRHRWKNDVCVHCALEKEFSQIDACDCGCRSPILKDTQTTHYEGHTFIFGHETIDMFEEKMAQ